MQTFRLCMSALLLALTTACFVPTEPDLSPINGVWAAPTGILRQGVVGGGARTVGREEMWFSFNHGSFLSERHVYGGYEGEPVDQLSLVEQLEGDFWIAGSRITISISRQIRWVRSEGTSFKLSVTPYRQRLFDDVSMALNDPHLTMQWISYPDDSPHLTELTLTRSEQKLHALGPVIWENRTFFSR